MQIALGNQLAIVTLKWNCMLDFYWDISSRSLTWSLIKGKLYVYQVAYFFQVWFYYSMAGVEARSSCFSLVWLVFESFCIFPIFWLTRWQRFSLFRIYRYRFFWPKFSFLLLIGLGYHSLCNYSVMKLRIVSKILGFQWKKFVH